MIIQYCHLPLYRPRNGNALRIQQGTRENGSKHGKRNRSRPLLDWHPRPAKKTASVLISSNGLNYVTIIALQLFDKVLKDNKC